MTPAGEKAAAWVERRAANSMMAYKLRAKRTNESEDELIESLTPLCLATTTQVGAAVARRCRAMQSIPHGQALAFVYYRPDN